MSWKASCALVCATYGVAQANVDLANVGDIEALSLEDLLERPIVSASRYAQRPASTPILVSSVDAEHIDALGYRSLGEALRGMRGTYLSNDRNYSYLGSRGFSTPGDYNTRFALSIDGHRMNDPVFGQAQVGLELGLPLIAVERVELLRGGAWSVYGQNALLGAINVVTATGASRPGLHVRGTTNFTAETFGDAANRSAIAPRTQDVSASYGYAKRDLDVFAAATLQIDPGLSALSMPELATEDTTCVDANGLQRVCDGVVIGGDGERLASAYLSLRKNEIAVRSLVSTRTKEVPTGSFGTLVGEPTTTYDNRAYGDVSYTHAGKRTDVEARFAVDVYDYGGDYPFAYAREGYEELPASRVVNDDKSTAWWISAELRGRRKWKRLGRHIKEIELAAGVETQQQTGTQINVDLYPEGSFYVLDRRDNARMFALTTHGSARFFDHLVAFAAIRGDYYPDAFGRTVNPQLGLVVDLEERGRIRASLARGFRAPNLYETHWVTIGEAQTLSTTTSLKPEESETREVSYERYLSKRVRAIAVGFTQEVSGLVALATLPNGDQRFINEGTARSQGVELELDARWPSLQLRANVAHQRSEDGSGSELVNSPRWLANATALVPVGTRGLLAFEGNYISSRLTLGDTKIAPTFLATSSYTFRNIIENVDLSLGVRNLFDVRTGVPGSEEHIQTRIPTEPRTVWFSLTARLGGDK